MYRAGRNEMYFNPRSHEGSDEVSDEIVKITKIISIHAPTKGATENQITICVVYVISIHAPTKGATDLVIDNLSGWLISIHAPTKGATPLHYVELNNFEFQSTLPRRERPKEAARIWLKVIFQSTLPRRERHKTIEEKIFEDDISIHAPTKGATDI